MGFCMTVNEYGVAIPPPSRVVTFSLYPVAAVAVNGMVNVPLSCFLVTLFNVMKY